MRVFRSLALNQCVSHIRAIHGGQMSTFIVGNTYPHACGHYTVLAISEDGWLLVELEDSREFTVHSTVARNRLRELEDAAHSITPETHEHTPAGAEYPKVALSDSALCHPESSLERDTLEETRRLLRQEVAALGKHANAAADGKAGADLWKLRQAMRHDLEELLQSAYFGRLVFRNAITGDETDIYIAHHAFNGGSAHVVDWRAPVGALFYAGIARRLDYQAKPGARISVNLDLKRRYVVDANTLEVITDDVDYRGSDPTRVKAIRERARKRAQENLAGDLGVSRDLQLKEIITTIQAEQDALIRAPVDRILAVSGVAGSGKTSVAYHRLSFLAYSGIDPSKMLFLGPNHLFLAYARSIVPELGLGQMIHSTFTDWALTEVYVEDGRLTSKEARRQREGHTYVLDFSTATKMDRARTDEVSLNELRAYYGIRGELRLAELMSRWAGRLSGVPQEPRTDLEWAHSRYPSVAVSISAERAAQAMRGALASGAAHPGRARTDTVNSLVRLARATLLELVATTSQQQFSESKDAVRNSAARELDLAIEKWVDEWWERPSATTDYYRLISNLDLLIELGEGLLDDDEILALHAAKQPLKRGVRTEDVPAILALHVQLHAAQTDYSHVVVDEGQDFSPLQYWSLAQHCTGRSMTILGDLSQGVYSYRGIDSWDSARTALGRRGWKAFHIRRSYRSTAQITMVCNAILTSLPGHEGRTAIAFPRRGARPKLIRANNRSAAYAAVAQLVGDAERRGMSSIAVICPDQLAARRMQRRLKEIGVSCVLLDDESDTHSGCCVMSAQHAKGLEFDVAVVTDTDAEHYRAGIPQHGRELYVAATRAVHELAFVFTGSMTPFLDAAQTKCDATFLKSPVKQGG